MTEALALELVDKGLMTKQIVLTIGYDTESMKGYTGEVTTDRYGRKIPKHAHGTANLERYTASSRLLTEAALSLFDRIMDKDLLTRRVYLTAARVLPEAEAREADPMEQLNLFSDWEQENAKLDRERRMQEAMLEIKRKYGKNAILKGTSFQEGATGRERNNTVGGHKV